MACYVNPVPTFNLTQRLLPTEFRPAKATPPDYKTIYHQPATAVDDSPQLPPDRAKRIQEIFGVFLYYAKAVDPNLTVSMLVVVNKIGSLQAKHMEQVEAMATHLLQYDMLANIQKGIDIMGISVC
jgi:hypothetical protein